MGAAVVVVGRVVPPDLALALEEGGAADLDQVEGGVGREEEAGRDGDLYVFQRRGGLG